MASISVLFTTGAQAATVVNLGSASGFSVLGGSAITNVPTTTMSNDLGLYPGTSVSGAPQTLGTAYVNDGVAQQGQTDLGTAITAATAQPGTAVTGGVLGGRPSSPRVCTQPRRWTSPRTTQSPWMPRATPTRCSSSKRAAP